MTTIDLLVEAKKVYMLAFQLQRNGHGKINVVGLEKLCLSKDYEQTMLSLHCTGSNHMFTMTEWKEHANTRVPIYKANICL